MSVPNFTNFPSEVSGALLSGSNGLSVAVVTGTPDKMVISAPNLTGVNNISATSITGTTIITPNLNVSSSDVHGFIEIGGPSGGFIDLKKPYSDDYDLRIYSGYIYNADGVIENFNGVAKIALSGANVGIGTTSPQTKLDVSGTIRSRSNDQYTGLSIRNSTNIIASIFGDSAGNESGLLELNNNGVRTIQLFSAGNSYMLSGNVGIGTSSPSQKLSVNGNISADGITFGAAGGTGTPTGNLLSDYEEGTWTPTINSGFTGTSLTIFGSNYVKIGNCVYITARFNFSGGTATIANFILSGLPFTSKTSQGLGIISLNYAQFTSAITNYIVGNVPSNTKNIEFFKVSLNTISNPVVGTEIGTLAVINIAGFYFT